MYIRRFTMNSFLKKIKNLIKGDPMITVKNITEDNVDIYIDNTHKQLQPGKTAELTMGESVINIQLEFMKHLVIVGKGGAPIVAPVVEKKAIPARSASCLVEEAIAIMETFPSSRPFRFFLKKEKRPDVLRAATEIMKKF